MKIPTLSELNIENLGGCTFKSPLNGRNMRFSRDTQRVVLPSLAQELSSYLDQRENIPTFELAGARQQLYFNPVEVRCAVITCGGICPGLNDVIRSITLTAIESYGVKEVWGFRFGFAGLSKNSPLPPQRLTPDTIRNIQDSPGTVLGSSRGPQDAQDMVNTLLKYEINMLFTIGGEGTIQGASLIAEEIKRRNLKISVIGIPKTIDNDISWIERSFGFATAVEAAKEVLNAAHAEATSAFNGVGLVKLMGRHSGFIAAHATLATANVNFCLVPEVPFQLEGEYGLLMALEKRLERRNHALIVVGEGAGQYLIEDGQEELDPSGNLKLKDIGQFIQNRIKKHFSDRKIPLTIKYIDPSYTIRSLPANAVDSEFCVLLGQCAVHAAMAGKTSMVIGKWNQHFTHIPNNIVVQERKQVELSSETWQTVLALTHQPEFDSDRL
jgi:6-phosphofructokinase 1